MPNLLFIGYAAVSGDNIIVVDGANPDNSNILIVLAANYHWIAVSNSTIYYLSTFDSPPDEFKIVFTHRPITKELRAAVIKAINQI